jgi:serine protease Do
MGAIEQLEEELQRIARELGPVVVGLGRRWALGSGIVVAPARVLTTAHSLRGGRGREEEVELVFDGGRRTNGRIIGIDPDIDVAVIEADTGDAQAPEWAQDTTPPLGRAVFALANPGGLGLRVTSGFVSASGRSFRGPRGRRIAGAIEHTAPLPRGSSGGPLLDREGQLLGINAVRVDGGLILAIPADAALRQRVDALSRGEGPRRAHLGVAIAPPRVARRLRDAVGLPEREGVLVRAVEEGTAAERAGLQRGDLIVAAAGKPIERIDALYEALDGVTSDGRLELAVVRALEERTLSVSF